MSNGTVVDFSKDVDGLKSRIFYDILNIVGRVFVIVRHAPDVVIGQRGFLDTEKHNGLVLVFNQRMDFTWGANGLIEAVLQFDGKPETCSIPSEHILAIYSPEIQVQFVSMYQREDINSPVENGTGKDETTAGQQSSYDNVLRVDFTKKKKK
ncbi:MAG: ClpXP protease specificity-enhancing factor SspB [Nitrospirae bacterium YQR-1]